MPSGPCPRSPGPPHTHHLGPCSRTCRGAQAEHTAQPALVSRPSVITGAWAAHVGGGPACVTPARCSHAVSSRSLGPVRRQAVAQDPHHMEGL
eukprot:14745617-Alexandrium_andersonii.AAC.1